MGASAGMHQDHPYLVAVREIMHKNSGRVTAEARSLYHKYLEIVAKERRDEYVCGFFLTYQFFNKYNSTIPFLLIFIIF